MLGGIDTFIIHNSTPKSLSTGIKGIDGNELILDPDYNKYKHTSHIGTIHALPVSINKNKYSYDIELNVGDQVLFHHFVCQPDHKVNIGEGLYRCEYFHIYGKFTDNGLEALEDLIFVDPIKETEADVTNKNGLVMKSTLGVIKQQGIVVIASKKAQEYGVMKGDKVFFTKSADYVIPIEDKKFYRMRIRNIIAVERAGKLVTLKDKILIKNIPTEQKSGVLFCVEVSNRLTGEVIDAGSNLGLSAGDKICYFNGVNGSFIYKGEEFSFVDVRHINYLIQNDMSIPVLNRVMILQDAGQDKIGILEIPQNAQVKPRKGTVLEVGPGKRNETDGAIIPMQVKKGDRVIYGEYGSINISVDGQEVVMATEENIILVL